MEKPPLNMQGSCWYNPAVIEAMNRAHSQHKAGADALQHTKTLKALIKAIADKASGRKLRVLDIGCGTGHSSIYFNANVFTYAGCDLKPIIEGCAKVNYPNNHYFYCDVLQADDLSFIEQYDVVLLNGVIDIMQDPLGTLARILPHCKGHVILHRQEVSSKSHTHSFFTQGYANGTYHSVINNTELVNFIDKYSFDVAEQLHCGFKNWENTGTSYLLHKRQSWALYGLDHKLYANYFSGKRNGFFIEAGANDGLRQSNTAYFERYHAWNGILVEPIKPEFEKCKKNRNVFVEQAALVSSTYPLKNILLRHTPGCHGLMSIVDDNEYADAHMAKAHEQGILQPCPARPLNFILNKHKDKLPHVIDLLVLDVEHTEFEALQGIDFDKWNIKVLMVEELNRDSSAIKNYLAKWYTCNGRISDNDVIYLRK